MFSLAIVYLPTSNVPSFTDLTLQVPMQYYPLQHRLYFHYRHIHNWASLPLWPNCTILSGAINNCPPLFCSRILDTFWPGGLIFLHHVFCYFILFMEFSRQEHWSGLPFSSPVHQVLSELFTVTCWSWVALQGMVHSFTELQKPLCHDKTMIHEGNVFYITILFIMWTFYNVNKQTKNTEMQYMNTA